MSLATKVFFAIDYFFDPFQNPKKQMKSHQEKVANATNIVYNDRYPDVCLLDTYVVPSDDETKKYPVIIEIHGGGFVAGDKKYRACLSAWYAVHTGAFVLNLNYGLAPKYAFPDPVKQLSAIFDWIKVNASELKFDLDNIIITGDSAGGYYSAYLAALATSKELQEKLDIHTDINIKATVLNCGIFDIRKALDKKSIRILADSICFDFAGVKLDQMDTYQYADIMSPIDFITAEYPQSFVIYSKKDIFCNGQGQLFIQKLQSYGTRCDSFGSTSVFDNHTFSLTWSSRASKKANNMIISFLNEIFDS